MIVSRETSLLLERYWALLLEENRLQNLIGRGSQDDLWQRHIVDSLQLIPLAPGARSWVDIGSGPGLPGMVIAIATGLPTSLVEPRKLRAAFLERVKDALALEAVTVIQGKAVAAQGEFDAITARAVARAPDLLRMTMHLSHKETRWVLPKGRTARLELEALQASWQGRFRVEQSRTDPASGILIAEAVRPRGRR